MSVIPLRSRPVSQRSGERLLNSGAGRFRPPPDAGGLARRRLVINLVKWLLPAVALLLLATIAFWPEIDRLRGTVRVAYERMGSEVGGATVTDAHYRGVDEQGRPYTLTAVTAEQTGPDRINLTTLKADMTLADGTWLMLQSKHGVFLKPTHQLDLSHDVVLYRDDGTTMTTASASVDLANGAAAGAEPTHVEGPFGTLDAQGFTVTDKGAAVQFAGPARLVLNGATR